MLCTKQKMRVKGIPVSVALKLFVACMLPILTYGAEIWTLFENLSLTLGPLSNRTSLLEFLQTPSWRKQLYDEPNLSS